MNKKRSAIGYISDESFRPLRSKGHSFSNFIDISKEINIVSHYDYSNKNAFMQSKNCQPLPHFII